MDADGFVTEGAATNAWIVTTKGAIVTRQLGPDVLAGVTRATLFDVISAQGLQLEERPFTPDEAIDAREAFITGATLTLMPVVSLNDTRIGDGRPGALSLALRQRFAAAAHMT